MNTTQGIYRIYNMKNGISYIGRSTNIEKRFYSHKNDLKSYRHCNYKIQEDYKKYGIGAFSFEVLEILEFMSASKERELFYMHKFKSTGLYNIKDPSTEWNPKLDNENTIFDTIPKELDGRVSYQVIKEDVYIKSISFIERMKKSDIEQDGIQYWHFYSLYEDISGQLYQYSSDIRVLSTLKEILEEEGFKVVHSTRNWKRRSRFIPRDVESYVIMKNDDLYRIRYRFDETLEKHIAVKEAQKKKEEERRLRGLKGKDRKIAEQNSEIIKLKKMLKIQLGEEKLNPIGDVSYQDIIKKRVQSNKLDIKKSISSKLNESKFMYFDDAINVLIDEEVVIKDEVDKEGNIKEIKRFLRVALSMRVKMLRTSITDLKDKGVAVGVDEIKNRGEEIIIFFKN